MNIIRILLVTGILLVFCAFAFYPPLEFWEDSLASLIACFGAMTVCLRTDRITDRRALVLLVPWLLAAVFLANGALDHSDETRYPTVVIATNYDWGIVKHSVTVRSWRAGQTSELIPLRLNQPFYDPKEKVSVGVKSGAFGIPWVNSFSRTLLR
jgi:hypothetical protein